MKAYKCDISNQYCEEVYTIHGISNPDTFTLYSKGSSFECNKEVYEKIMRFIQNLAKEYGNELC